MCFNGAGHVAAEQGATEAPSQTFQVPGRTSVLIGTSLVLSLALCKSYSTLIYCRAIKCLLYFLCQRTVLL